jgi:hypothetical protein
VTTENLTAQRRIEATPHAVFAVLADPGNHAAIDGTGWVRGPLQDGVRITAVDEVFDMAMFHPQHPDGDYEIANRVVAFEPPTAIGWEPGFYVQDGHRDSGRWTWRYDLAEIDSQTDVTLTYDWSNATPDARERFEFPPFGVEKLTESLDNLAKLTT